MKTFLVVRCLKDKQGNQKGYSLKAGDVIKFGRMGFRVKETQDEDGNFEQAAIKKDDKQEHEKYL